jgi:hypothetical protein
VLSSPTRLMHPEHLMHLTQLMNLTHPVLVLSLLLATAPAVASAQTRGRVGVGAGLSVYSPKDGTETVVSVSPLLRLPPRTGWRPTIGFNWIETSVEPGPGDLNAWRLRTRPVMVGVQYTRVVDRAAVNGSFVIGPSFNKATLRGSRWPAGSSVDIDRSIAYRIGGAYNYSLTERVGVQVFAAYLVNRADVTFRRAASPGTATLTSRRFRADTPVVSVSAVYSLF